MPTTSRASAPERCLQVANASLRQAAANYRERADPGKADECDRLAASILDITRDQPHPPTPQPKTPAPPSRTPPAAPAPNRPAPQPPRAQPTPQQQHQRPKPPTPPANPAKEPDTPSNPETLIV